MQSPGQYCYSICYKSPQQILLHHTSNIIRLHNKSTLAHQKGAVCSVLYMGDIRVYRFQLCNGFIVKYNTAGLVKNRLQATCITAAGKH
jgi:hypothetical protein